MIVGRLLMLMSLATTSLIESTVIKSASFRFDHFDCPLNLVVNQTTQWDITYSGGVNSPCQQAQVTEPSLAEANVTGEDPEELAEPCDGFVPHVCKVIFHKNPSDTFYTEFVAGPFIRDCRAQVTIHGKPNVTEEATHQVASYTCDQKGPQRVTFFDNILVIEFSRWGYVLPSDVFFILQVVAVTNDQVVDLVVPSVLYATLAFNLVLPVCIFALHRVLIKGDQNSSEYDPEAYCSTIPDQTDGNASTAAPASDTPHFQKKTSI